MTKIIINKYLPILVFLLIPMLISFGSQEGDIVIGIDENLGAKLPMDTEFVTSKGDTVKLSELVNKPFLLDLVYYNCPGICHPLLTQLTWAVDRLQMDAGESFQVVTLSFDPHEKYKLAAKWKKNYINSMKREMPEGSWLFLTGDSVNIKKITDVVGFRYQANDKNYTHAGSVVAVSPDGKLSRYIYGSTFNPFDLKMALIDAQNEETRPTSAKLLQLCFSYDPSGRKYTLNITRIIGSLMMIAVFTFLGVLVFKKRKTKGVKIDG